MYLHLAALLVSLTVAAAAAVAEDWPQFRGPGGDGVSSAAGVPLRWSETQNVRWKTAIPGLGHASPVISQRCVFILTASASDPDPRLRVGLYGDIAPVQDEGSHRW